MDYNQAKIQTTDSMTIFTQLSILVEQLPSNASFCSVCKKSALAIKEKTLKQNMVSSKCLKNVWSQFLNQFYW